MRNQIAAAAQHVHLRWPPAFSSWNPDVLSPAALLVGASFPCSCRLLRSLLVAAPPLTLVLPLLPLQIKTFYDFVKQWKQRETEAAESLKCGVRGAWEGGGTFNVDGYGNVTVKLGEQVGQAPGLTI